MARGFAGLIRYAGEFMDTVIERADGAWLTTVDGRRILDFTSGQMCATLGHNHPAIVHAIREATERVLHLYSGMVSPDVLALAEELFALLPEPLRRAMFVNTGGESNQSPPRIAQLHTRGLESPAPSRTLAGHDPGAAASTCR